MTVDADGTIRSASSSTLNCALSETHSLFRYSPGTYRFANRTNWNLAVKYPDCMVFPLAVVCEISSGNSVSL
jgi:hypothetical protein